MPIQLPAYLKKPDNKFISKLTGGIGGSQPPTISRKNNKFTLIGANGEPVGSKPPSLTLDVVVVGGNDHPSKIYYENDYDPNDTAAPDCFSDNGTAPSAQAQKPQAELCSSCPQNVWGSRISRISGKKVQACSTYKKVAVVVLGDNTGTVFLLMIPPASLKGWLAYMNHLGANGVSPDQVITRISFGDDMLGVLNFNMVDFIPENFVEPIEKIVASDDPDLVSGNRDKPLVTATALPVQAKPALAFHEPPPAPAAAQEAPKPRGRQKVKPLVEETVVERGPIPPGTFAGPGRTEETVEELEARLAAAKAKQHAPAGVMPSAPAPSSEIEKMLDQAFKLPVRKE